MKQIDLIAFKRKNAKKRRIYAAFLRNLPQRKVRGLNSLAVKMTAETFAEIDCRRCANCCKTMTPTYTRADIIRIAAHLNITPDMYKEKYLYQDDVGDWLHKSTPCHFLGKSNLCTIYEIRPLDCSGYPHTHKKNFMMQTDLNVQNLSYCPATFRMVEKIYEIVEGKK